jgi:hypothetical protein
VPKGGDLQHGYCLPIGYRASVKVFVFGALRHQLLYEFGDAAMSSSLRSSISFWGRSSSMVGRRSTMPVAVLEVIVVAR